MALSTPDWLAQRDGKLLPSKGLEAYAVYFADQLQYVLVSAPAKGKFAVRITQTINGRRTDDDRTYPTAEDAIRGGLERLREKLGW